MTLKPHRAFAAALVLAIAEGATPALADSARDAWRNGDAKLGARWSSAIASRATPCLDATRRASTRAERGEDPGAARRADQPLHTQLGAGYFPDEEEHIAAYLNERYYHF
jgi:hypothetical protein